MRKLITQTLCDTTLDMLGICDGCVCMTCFQFQHTSCRIYTLCVWKIQTHPRAKLIPYLWHERAHRQHVHSQCKCFRIEPVGKPVSSPICLGSETGREGQTPWRGLTRLWKSHPPTPCSQMATNKYNSIGLWITLGICKQAMQQVWHVCLGSWGAAYCRPPTCIREERN